MIEDGILATFSWPFMATHARLAQTLYDPFHCFVLGKARRIWVRAQHNR